MTKHLFTGLAFVDVRGMLRQIYKIKIKSINI